MPAGQGWPEVSADSGTLTEWRGDLDSDDLLALGDDRDFECDLLEKIASIRFKH